MFHRLAVFCFLFIAFTQVVPSCERFALAQDQIASSPGGEETSKSNDTETSSEPVLLDRKDGDTVAVPRPSYEQFEEYLQQRNESAANLPEAVVLHSLAMTGKVEGEFLHVNIRITADINRQFSSALSIPLSLSDFIVEDFKSDGVYSSHIIPIQAERSTASNPSLELGRPSLSDVPASGPAKSSVSELRRLNSGLIWEVFPSPQSDDGGEAVVSRWPKSCEITLTGYIRIEKEEWRRTASFNLPAVPNKLEFVLESESQNIQWSDDLNQLVQQEIKADGVLVKRAGMGGSSELTWQNSNQVEKILTTEIESSTRYEASLDGAAWNAITKLQIKTGVSVAPREFIINLPENGKWKTSSDFITRNGWTLTRMPTSLVDTESVDPKSKSNVRLLLRVTADELKLQKDLFEVQWTWQPPVRVSEPFRLPAVHIDDVQRHEGIIDVIVPPESQFTWKVSTGAGMWKRSLQGDTAKRINYSFKFSRVPVDITCTLRKSVDRLQYSPEFIACINKDNVELIGFLNFATDPTELAGLEIDPGDWVAKSATWDQSGKDIKFEQNADRVLRFDPINLYSSSEAGAIVPATGASNVVKLSLIKPLDAFNEPNVSILLPKVLWLDPSGNNVSEVGSGRLSVVNSYWPLAPESVETRSLISVEDTPAKFRNLATKSDASKIRNYIFDESKGEPLWTTKLDLNLGPSVVEEVSTITVANDHLSLLQQFSVRNNKFRKPTYKLQLPASFASSLDQAIDPTRKSENLQLRCNGTSVSYEILGDENELFETNDAPATASAVLIKPLIDESVETFSLALEYKIPLPENTEGRVTEIDNAPILRNISISLPNLLADQPLINAEPKIFLNNDSSLRIEVSNTSDAKSIDPTILYPGQDKLNVTPWINRNPQDLNTLSCSARHLDIVDPPRVEIQKIWLQTALSGSDRRDRCVLDLITAESQLELTLPQNQVGNLATVLIKGQRIEPRRIAGTTSLIVPLRSDQTLAPQRYTIELWSFSKAPKHLINRLEEVLPSIAGATRPAPKYWQVIVPEHDHIWTRSKSLMPENRWEMSGFMLRRVDPLDQRELEIMTFASEQPVLGSQANRYLFTSLATSLNGAIVANDAEVFIVPRYILFGPICLVCIAMTSLLLYLKVLRRTIFVTMLALLVIVSSAVSLDLAIMLLQCVGGSLFFVILLIAIRWSIDSKIRKRSIFSSRSKLANSSSISSNKGKPAALEDDYSLSYPIQKQDLIGSDRIARPNTNLNHQTKIPLTGGQSNSDSASTLTKIRRS